MEAAMTRRHIFISHHHADDKKVDQLTDLLARGGSDVRNSSVRMKPIVEAPVRVRAAAGGQAAVTARRNQPSNCYERAITCF